MIKKSRTIGKILGVPITGTKRDQLLSEIDFEIKRGRKKLVLTPNPENLLKAQYDPTLLEVLCKADYTLPDGVGLVAWHKFITLPCPKDPFKRVLTLFVQGLGVSFSILFNRGWLFSELEPIKGREFAVDLIELAHRRGYSVFLLGGEIGEAKRAERKLKTKYPGLKLASLQGPMLNDEANPKLASDKTLLNLSLSKINKFAPDILLVGMTCPKQEKWLYRYLPKVNAKIGMAVGGTYRYLSGERLVPPKIVNDLGLEWLWRLATGSQDIDRIGKAVWEFPAKVFWNKLKGQK